jgi:hypothetical protein
MSEPSPSPSITASAVHRAEAVVTPCFCGSSAQRARAARRTAPGHATPAAWARLRVIAFHPSRSGLPTRLVRVPEALAGCSEVALRSRRGGRAARTAQGPGRERHVSRLSLPRPPRCRTRYVRLRRCRITPSPRTGVARRARLAGAPDVSTIAKRRTTIISFSGRRKRRTRAITMSLVPGRSRAIGDPAHRLPHRRVLIRNVRPR